MTSTTLFTVTNSGPREAVVAATFCNKITIREDPSVANWPTTDFQVSNTPTGSQVAQRPSGTEFQFKQKLYSPGQVVGYVETITGSTTFQQIEELE